MKQISIEMWVCPYCNTLHDDETDAYDCANNCVDVEQPTKENVLRYQCEICQQSYEKRNDALDCEDKHERGNDKKYQEYLDGLQKAKLRMAASHNEQIKLNEVQDE